MVSDLRRRAGIPRLPAARAARRVTRDDRPRKPATTRLGSISICRRQRGPDDQPRRGMVAPPRHRTAAVQPHAMSDRNSSPGLPISRAIARDCSTRSRLSGAAITEVSNALSASRPRTDSRRHTVRVLACVGQNGEEPGKPFQDAPPRDSHSGCSDDTSRIPPSMSACSRLHANAARRLSISVSHCSIRSWRPELVASSKQGCHGCVVVAVSVADVVSVAGLAELFLRVLAHRFHQPVSCSAACVFGHDERFVDEQGEQVEHLVTV